MHMDFLESARNIVGAQNIIINEPMALHTTFRAGGKADYVVTPDNANQIVEILKLCVKYEMPYYVIGNGSNLLVSDDGFRGMIILTKKVSNVTIKDDIVTAEAGALLSVIGRAVLKSGLTGFEFAAGIPGSIGGACLMNAGAYGGEMKDILISATAVNPEGQIFKFTNEEMKLGYRTSTFVDSNFTILEAVFKLTKGNSEEIEEKMKELAYKRRSKQPLEFPSGGSTFKRPEGNFAGALIEQAGLKGMGFGDACISEKHAGFVINKGNATAGEIYATIMMVIEKVKEASGIVLEPEIKFLGKF